MSTRFHGRPCWFELGTTDLAGAARFYGAMFGWQTQDSGMEGFDYHLARLGGDMVAGLMTVGGPGLEDVPPNWLTYIASDDVDATVAAARAAGASVVREPEDIPGTGRYAILRDPQGAHFGVLQPDMSHMTPEQIAQAEAGGGAWNQAKAGHGNWLELMSTDPDAGFDFYAGLFGWRKGERMEMGEAGAYQLFNAGGPDIGGMMGLGDAPVPNWLPYFGVDGSVSAAMKAAEAGGGRVHHGTQEVPGQAWIAVMQDPQGAWFAVVGPQE